MTMVSLKHITKRFDDKLVLDHIDMELAQGEIFGLIGPNGAGKSTLIHILCGLLKADSGEVRIGGHDLAKDPIPCKRLIGLVPQALAVEKELSAWDNLEYFGAFYGLSGKLLKERIEESLEVTGLADRSREKVKKFSGGMLRRLNMGAALLHHPELLILDEPTVGVDAQSRNYTFDYLRRINKERGTTILYTSHYMEEVESLCSRIFIMDLGKEIACGTRAEILRMNHQTKSLQLSFQNEQVDLLPYLSALPGIGGSMRTEEGYRLVVPQNFVLEPLILKLHEDQHALKGISIEEPRLEEIFLSLTGKSLRD